MCLARSSFMSWRPCIYYLGIDAAASDQQLCRSTLGAHVITVLPKVMWTRNSLTSRFLDSDQSNADYADVCRYPPSSRSVGYKDTLNLATRPKHLISRDEECRPIRVFSILPSILGGTAPSSTDNNRSPTANRHIMRGERTIN